MRGRGPGWIRMLREMSPAEQERFLAGSPRFQRMPLPRQQMIRERLKEWNALTREQKGRMREREEIFLSLSPAQRQEARELFPRWRALPPERREALLQAFRRMRDLPHAQRQKFLASPEVEKRFSPEERKVLSGLGQLLCQGREAAEPGVREPEE